MRAMLLERPSSVSDKPLRAVELPVPVPAADEVLIKVLACGVCRTDLHVVEGELPDPVLPIVPGHQVVGVVTQCGSAAGRFKIGDRIGAAWLRRTCGICEFC